MTWKVKWVNQKLVLQFNLHSTHRIQYRIRILHWNRLTAKKGDCIVHWEEKVRLHISHLIKRYFTPDTLRDIYWQWQSKVENSMSLLLHSQSQTPTTHSSKPYYISNELVAWGDGQTKLFIWQNTREIMHHTWVRRLGWRSFLMSVVHGFTIFLLEAKSIFENLSCWNCEMLCSIKLCFLPTATAIWR